MGNAVTATEPAAIRDWIDGRMVFLELTDGRVFAFPAARFKRLKDASDENGLAAAVQPVDLPGR